MKLKEKIWLLAAPPHTDDVYFGTAVDRRIGCWSRITPGEGAHVLNTNNLIMMPSGGIPVPFSDDAIGYMESFCRMKNVWWGILGTDGFRIGNEEDFALKLSNEYENFTGMFANDLFVSGKSCEEIKSILKKVRETLKSSGRKMEIWASVYIDTAEMFNDEKLYEDLDGVVVWNRNTDEAAQMEEQFEIYEKLLPDKKKMLGMYMFDYVERKAVSVENVETLCGLAKRWICEGRIEGAVIRSNCTMGLGYDSDYFLRDWMEKVGEEEISISGK